MEKPRTIEPPNMKPEFYLDIDKSTGNWTYSLRLRKWPGQMGKQVATFNPYVNARYPRLVPAIIEVLNDALEVDDEFIKRTD